MAEYDTGARIAGVHLSASTDPRRVLAKIAEGMPSVFTKTLSIVVSCAAVNHSAYTGRGNPFAKIAAEVNFAYMGYESNIAEIVMVWMFFTR